METKSEIINTAERLFGRNGVEHTTMQEIATECKISKKTIYKHFESKDDLVMALYQSKFDYFNDRLNAIVSGELSFPEKLARILGVVEANLTFITGTLVSDLKQHYPEVKDRANSYVENAVFNRFKTLLEQGIASGHVKPNIDEQATIILYRDALRNYLNMSSLQSLPGEYQNSIQPDKLFKETLTTIFRGILTPNTERLFDQILQSSEPITTIK